MTTETIKTQLNDGILRITLNRPDRLNAFTGRMGKEVTETLAEAAKNDDVGAVIFTGEGRAYCAGADLSQGSATFDYTQREGDRALRDGGGMMTLSMYEFPKPIIGAINGAAVGVGVTMTLPMDIRLASESARFGFVFARRGIIPEAASSWFLPRVVGISQALEWCYSGRVFDAQEALAGRLVSKVLPAQELLPAAESIAREIIDNCAPVSVALTRQMMWRLLGADHPMQAHIVDSAGIRARGASNDSKEGVTSFLEKRNPEFPDKVSSDMPSYYPWWDEAEFKRLF